MRSAFRFRKHRLLESEVPRFLDAIYFPSSTPVRLRCDPLGAPGRSLKWIGEVLCLVRHFSVSELHDTHRKGAFAAVSDLILGDPEIAFSHDPPDGEVRRLPGVMAAQRLQISATVNYLA